MSNMEINAVENNNEEIIERAYELRKLKDSDLFPMLDIITKVIPEDLSEVFVSLVTKEKSIQEIGGIVVYRLIVSVLKNTGKVHNELYAVLSDLSGIPENEIADMPFGTTPMMIWDVVADAKNASFFKVLSKLL